MSSSAQPKIARWIVAVGSGLRTTWLFVGVVVICFVLLEGSARLVLALLPETDADFNETNAEGLKNAQWLGEYMAERHASSTVEWHSYVYWRHKHYAGSHINIDEDGIRRTWNADTRGLPPIRVFMFGGSTLFGRGARDDFTIPSQLAKAFSVASELPLEVTNFGESGYVSTQGLIALILELREGNVPDVAIFYDGVNDVFAAHQAGAAGLPQNEYKRRLDFEAFEVAFLLRVADRLSSLTLARRLLGRGRFTRGMATEEELASGELARQIVSTYKGNLKAVDGLARAFGFQALYFWQPMVLSRRSPTPHEVEIAERLTREQPGLYTLYRQTSALVEGDSELAADPRFHDLHDVLDGGTESFFIDFNHITEAGNARIAEAMLLPLNRALAER